MIVEHSYRPNAGLLVPLEIKPAAPEIGGSVKLQGDPRCEVVEGSIIGVEAQVDGSYLLFIDVSKDASGAVQIARWLADHGDLGVMIE